MIFDLQRFNDEQTADDAQVENSADDAQQESPQEELPEELGGLPEEYAREVLDEWKQSNPESEQQTESPAPAEEPPVTREQYQAAINELNQLKAKYLALNQAVQQQQPAPQRQQVQQPPQQQFQPPQFKITPEISKQINEAIDAEAMALSGMSKDDVASLDYADDNDPRIAQWNQAKTLAQSNVFSAIRHAQINQQQQARQFFDNHTAAVNTYNEFVQKEFAEPDFQAIQQFATNDFFEQLNPHEQKIIANSYLRVERQLASPAEMLVVKNYYERAKAAYRSRGAKPQRGQSPAQQAAKLPRSDQLKGTSTTSDGQLSTADIEKLLTQDFTTLTPKQQKTLLGLTG